MRSHRSVRRLIPWALAGALLLAPRPGVTELRPLVRAMLENLHDVNRIGLAVALEDFNGVSEAARELQARAISLQEASLEDLGIEDPRENQFDAYLEGQRQAAGAILEAAGEKDAAAVFAGVELLFGSSCMPCHGDFRERHQLLRPSAAFMTDMVHSWQDINRGLSVGDLDLVMRRSRDLQSVARVLTWNEVISQVFNVSEPERRIAFRQLAQQVSRYAGEIETAAAQEKLTDAVAAARGMWSEGCIACHQQFR